MPRLAGVLCALGLAAAGVASYLIISGHHPPPALPSTVLSTQAVSLDSPGRAGPAAWPGSSRAPGTLLAAPAASGGPGSGSTAPAGAAAGFASGVQPGPRWTADQMQGGTYTFIYLASGQCLAAAPPPASTALLQHCDLQASQRWIRQKLTVGKGGVGFWQLRSDAYGRCLTAPANLAAAAPAAQLRPCQAKPGWQQLIAIVPAT